MEDDVKIILAEYRLALKKIMPVGPNRFTGVSKAVGFVNKGVAYGKDMWQLGCWSTLG